MGLINNSELRKMFSARGLRVGVDVLEEFDSLMGELIGLKVDLLERALSLEGRKTVKKEDVIKLRKQL